jgi:predicted nucleotidyltransferase
MMTESAHAEHEQVDTSARVEETGVDAYARHKLVSKLHGARVEIVAGFVDAYARHKLVSKLRPALPRLLDGLPVRLAYLFGSSTTDQVTPFSDVDLALVVDGELSPLERLKLMLRVQLDLADSCDIKNADVRIINDAPLVLQGKVVCEGILVFSRDERERVAFETTTRLRYFDYQPIHQELQDAFFAGLRERGLYG